MKRSGAAKFPNSVQLFKFCQKVLMTQKGSKIHDQEVGSILNFNPSDCSHWKRGEKNVRSVFALAKLSDALGIEPTLIHDVASGHVGLDEAFFEWSESNALSKVMTKIREIDPSKIKEIRERVANFVDQIHEQCEFVTPPLYIPEVMRSFAFISTQSADMMDKLSRILRMKPGQYSIQFKKGDLRPQTRMSMANDLARIIFEGERGRFPELGQMDPEMVKFEELLFVASLLAPKKIVLAEMTKLDTRRNIVNELATMFWVPKSLVCFQMQDILRSGERVSIPRTTNTIETGAVAGSMIG